MNTDRSRAARAKAQNALVALLHELRDFDPPLIVLGGLVPDMLTRDQEILAPQHLGTTDVDVLIDFQVAIDKDLGFIEAALIRLGFSPKAGSDGWRWIGKIDGAAIKLEFLCELDNEPAETVIRPVGCTVLGAVNLRGTGFVREDWHVQELTGRSRVGEIVTVNARVAGLCGYLLAKAVAVRERGMEKDYYDFAYVLLYNRLGGPAPAAEAMKRGTLADRLEGLKTVWREVVDRFSAPDSIGAAG